MNKPLPQSKYNKEKYSSNYDRIFGKKEEKSCEKCEGEGYFTLDSVEVTCAECNDLLGVYEPDTLDGDR